MLRGEKSAMYGLCFLTRSAIDFLQAPSHKACKHRHHHLGFDLHKVIGQGVHLDSDFSRHWDRVSVSGKQRYGDGFGGETTGNLASDAYQGNLWGAAGGTYFALFSLSSGVISPLFTISYLMTLGTMVSIRLITGRLVLIDLSWNNTSYTIQFLFDIIWIPIWIHSVYGTVGKQYW